MVRKVLKIIGLIVLAGLVVLAIGAWRNWDTVQRVFLGGVKVYETVPPQVPTDLPRPAILVFSKTNAFRHEEAIPAANALFAIADGHGPSRHLITLGYAGWEAGQLETELTENAWLTCPADSDILFDTPFDQRLSAAAARLGINLSLLTAQAGHA